MITLNFGHGFDWGWEEVVMEEEGFHHLPNQTSRTEKRRPKIKNAIIGTAFRRRNTLAQDKRK